MEETIRSRRSFEQFVLLAVTELTIAGETPVRSYEVTQTIKDHLDDIARDPFGGVERQEVVSALSALAQADILVTEKTESATGKGRPAYESTPDVETVLAALEDADEVGPYARKLQATV